MKDKIKLYLHLLTSRHFLIMLFLGFSSGLPLALVSSTLEARYAGSSVDLTTIGLVSLVGLPYVLKPLWAPLLDSASFPFLGRRKGWILVTQWMVSLALLVMAFFDAGAHPVMLAVLALVTAYLAASQDIAIDAYRVDILTPEERGVGVALFVGAYRIAMLVSGGIAFILSDQIGWQWTYCLMALIMILGSIATIFAPMPVSDVITPPNLAKAILEPFKEFLSREKAIALLLFIVLYKLGDVFALKLLSSFLHREIGASMTEIGMVKKLGGFGVSLLGVFIGGFILIRTRLFTGLLVFGLLQAISNVLFVWLAQIGYNKILFITAICFEEFCAGLGTAAFSAFLMSLCNTRFSALQFSLLSSLTAVARETLGPLAAWVATTFGWVTFFEVSIFMAFPGLFLLYWLKPVMPEKLYQQDQKDHVSSNYSS